ncbi:MAG: hypothetical protein H6810_12065 [Phycisphaeraceae bacterium]|nr:MAG: hypothetical protein H6810_12065 [Phycisphaeraceae bacterium]
MSPLAAQDEHPQPSRAVADPGHRAYVICTTGRTLPGSSNMPGLVRIDPWKTSSGAFVDAVNALQQSRLGDLAVPVWALYDCAESTGAVVGLLDGAGKPVSMLATTPTLERGAWHFYAVCAHDPAVLAGTFSVAVEVLRPKVFSMVLPWEGGAFGACLEIGAMELVTARTPCHTEPRSATVRVRPGAATPAGNRATVNTRDAAALQRLQEEIEQGIAYMVVEPPSPSGVVVLERVKG